VTTTMNKPFEKRTW